jgi:hypothetical protein
VAGGSVSTKDSSDLFIIIIEKKKMNGNRTKITAMIVGQRVLPEN